jgi:hypothetical protein
MGFLQGPSVRRNKELLKLNRNQLRWVTGLLVGHCHLKAHLSKMGLTCSPVCESCLQKDESATHILCDCEATAHLRFHHKRHHFTESGDYHDTPVCMTLHFIRSVRLLKGWNRGGCTIDYQRLNYAFIQSFIHVFIFIMFVFHIHYRKGHSFVCKESTHLGINGRFYVAIFIYARSNHEVLSLSNVDLPNTAFSKNLTLMLGQGLTVFQFA